MSSHADIQTANESIQDFPGNYNDHDAIISSTHHYDNKTYQSTMDSNSLDGNDKGTQPRPTTPPPSRNYSVMRARVVSSLVLVLFSMSAPISAITSQYLRHRMYEDADFNKSLLANKTVCGVQNQSDPLVKQENDIQSKVSQQQMYLSYTISVPAIFACLFLGSYSDVLGRRLALLLPLLGSLSSMIMSFLIMRFDMSINFFYVSSLLDGIGGSYYGLFIASFAISVDLSTGKSQRIIWLVLIEAIARVTIASTSTIIGILIHDFGFSVAGLFLIIPAAMAFLIALFLMPETRAKQDENGKSDGNGDNEKKQKSCCRVVLKLISLSMLWSHVVRMVRMYTSGKNPRDRKALLIALVLLFLVVFSSLHVASINVLYQQHNPFCWDSRLIGYYGAVANVGQAVVGTVFLKTLQALGIMKDEKIAMISTLFQIGGYVMESVIDTTWEFFLIPVVIGPFFASSGIVRGVMSYLVGPNNQGAMFASLAVMESLANIVAATILNETYSATVGTFPGTVYLVVAGIGVLNFLLYFVFFRYYDDPASRNSQDESHSQQGKPEDEENKRGVL